jgi:DNA-binding NtrC family response regulator
MVKCRGDLILPSHLPPEITRAIPGAEFAMGTAPAAHGQSGRRPKLREESVQLALTKAGGNKAKAARMLGVGRATLYNFIREHESLAGWAGE